MGDFLGSLFGNDPTQTEVPWTLGDYFTGAVTGRIPDAVNAQQNKDLYGNILAAGGTAAQAQAAVNEQNTFVSRFQGGTGGTPLSAIFNALGLSNGSVPPAGGTNWAAIALIVIAILVVFLLMKR